MDAEVTETAKLELTHPFEGELFSLVTTPHCHAQRGINEEKEKFLEYMRGELTLEDPGTRDCLLSSYEASFPGNMDTRASSRL